MVCSLLTYHIQTSNPDCEEKNILQPQLKHSKIVYNSTDRTVKYFLIPGKYKQNTKERRVK